MKTLIREGSAKSILRGSDHSVLFRFKDTFSAFDVGPHPQEIPGKGVAVCDAAVTSFLIAKAIGIPTGFQELVDKNTIRVQELSVIDSRPLCPADRGCIVPAEWIFRFNAAGSLLRAFADGSKKPTDFGFPADVVPAEGAILPMPVHQWTTKWESTDRELSENEALALCGLTARDAAEYWRLIDTLNGAINLVFAAAGYYRFDGKIEVGLGPNREKLIADVFGTPDEDRPVPSNGYNGWPIEHHGKEYLRQELIRAGYFKELKEARRLNQPDPSYPSLPDATIAEASRRYGEFARRYREAFHRLFQFEG